MRRCGCWDPGTSHPFAWLRRGGIVDHDAEAWGPFAVNQHHVSNRAFVSEARALGVAVDDDQGRAFARYRDEIVAWNETTNLTGLKDPNAIDETLVSGSLELVPLVLAREGLDSSPLRLIDVGSGAGIPGLPLKIAVGDRVDVVLLDSNGKKAQFLRHAVEVLGPTTAGTRVIAARAEDVGRTEEHREAYDVAVARAVGSIRVLAELCVPLVRVGGRVLLPRGRDYEREAAHAVRAIEAVGGRLATSDHSDRSVVVIEKIAPTPSGFPRRVGVPRKRPL